LITLDYSAIGAAVGVATVGINASLNSKNDYNNT